MRIIKMRANLFQLARKRLTQVTLDVVPGQQQHTNDHESGTCREKLRYFVDQPCLETSFVGVEFLHVFHVTNVDEVARAVASAALLKVLHRVIGRVGGYGQLERSPPVEVG